MPHSKTKLYLRHDQNLKLNFGPKALLSSPLIFVFWCCLLLLPFNEAKAVKPPESAEDYAVLKGENFAVIRVDKGNQVWSKAVELKLIEVSKPTLTGKIEQFSVRFQGPKKFPLDKAVHNFDNAKTGQFSLFLEPADGDSKYRYYEAFFNLLKK